MKKVNPVKNQEPLPTTPISLQKTLQQAIPDALHEELCSGGCAQFAVALQRTFGGKLMLAWRRERGEEWVTLSHCCALIHGYVFDHSGMNADIAWEERFEDCDGVSLWKWQSVSRLSTLRKHCKKFGVTLRESKIKKWEKILRKTHQTQLTTPT